MFSLIPFSLVLMSFMKYEMISAKNVRRFVYQKDISEHCRRRVMPSVFLGRHVVDANSQILHFTRLELPYSCYISVRSESGTNIIMALQILSEESIATKCSKQGDQFLVYEMDEAFGGYWGPLSDSIIKREPYNDTKYYTLKTTQSTEPSTIDSDEYEDALEVSTETVKANASNVRDDSDDYIRMELPLANVSANFIPGEAPRKDVYDIDDSFDLIYDVTPRRGVYYDTSIVPLVQFSLNKKIKIHRTDDKDKSDYEIKYNNYPVTVDERLFFSTRYMQRNKYRKQKYNANKRLNFKTNNSLFATYSKHLYTEKLLTITKQHILTKSTRTLTKPKSTTESISPFNNKVHNNVSWEFIDDILKMYNKTPRTTTVKETRPVYYNISNLFQNILDTKYNSSVYLSPNLSVYYKDVPLHAPVIRKITASDPPIQILHSTSVFLTKSSLSPMKNKERPIFINITESSDIIKENIGTLATHLLPNITEQKETHDTLSLSGSTPSDSAIPESTYSPVSERNGNMSGSLVGRESWENVVQVAPVMAGLLNNMTSNQRQRRKRYIQSVHIQIARPHNITIRENVVTTAAIKYDVRDMQDFAQLVEIQDDELHGRVALRYLRGYVGPALLNICDYTDTAMRHVYLFNSSRIVIAISNFTMDRMTVVLTPARTVMTGEGRCPDSHIECQVSGARVCIDSLTACDGIPNCGSYDIYDEDRLMCGAAMGLQHNVYLAAFTFLAVLLTVLYGVHYWLKRCVPNVSGAFFLYTDGSENVLYLDTIMRSPTDDYVDTKMVDTGIGFEDDLLIFSEVNEGQKTNKMKRFFKSFLTCSYFRQRPKKQEAYDTMVQEGLFASLTEEKKRYSYAELELRKMLDTERRQKDIAVQTSVSLEMSYFNRFVGKPINNLNQDSTQRGSLVSDSLVVLTEDSPSTLEQLHKKRYPDELSILNFFNNTKSESSKSKSSEDLSKLLARSSIIFEEREIQSHHYDHKPKPKVKQRSSKLADAHEFGIRASDRIKKQLRFDEGHTTIPAVEYDEDSNDDDIHEHLSRRRSVVLGEGKTWQKRDLNSIEEGDEGNSNPQGHSIRFWNKSKKTKKKM